jgi:8-oxo-dGTP pyrophosphatase MutT (NUDIX family)
MPNKQDDQSSAGVKVETLDQISAGRVAFRWQDSDLEVAIVSVRPKLRWQLPKGIVDPGESPQVTIAHAAIVEDIIPYPQGITRSRGDSLRHALRTRIAPAPGRAMVATDCSLARSPR